MKLKIEDLIIDNYYVCYYSETEMYCFKYKGFRDEIILSDGWHISKYKNTNDGYYHKSSSLSNTKYAFCTSDFYNKCTIFEQIDFTFIIKYFPKNHIEIINHRKHQIKYLLSI